MTPFPHDPVDRSGPDEPDRRLRARAGHLDPSDPHLLERLGVVVPDDARALDGERQALFGESASGPRIRLVHTFAAARPASARTALTLMLMLVAVAAVLAGSLLAMLTPRANIHAPGTLALASNPVNAPGRVGGLLPDAGVRVDNAVGIARILRPAVLFVPPDATCVTCGRQERPRAWVWLPHAMTTLSEIDPVRSFRPREQQVREQPSPWCRSRNRRRRSARQRHRMR